MKVKRAENRRCRCLEYTGWLQKSKGERPLVVTTFFVDSLSVVIILVAGFPGWKGR